MKVTTKRLPASRQQVTVGLDAGEVTELFDHALGHIAHHAKVAGFRPGKAPKEIVKEQTDPTKLREEAYALAVQQSWQKIVADLKELPIQEPEVELKQFEEGKSAELLIEFDVRPVVKVGAWQKIKLRKTKEEAVSDKEVDELIQSLARAHAKSVVKLTEAKKGDKVHVSFEGSIKGVLQEKLTSKNFPLVIGHAETIPGFDEQLVGLKKGGKKTFTLKFPDNHFDKTLANQSVEFKAEIEEVFEVILPELNKEFADSFGHKTFEGLKKAIRKDIETRKSDDQFVSQKAKWLAEFEKLVSCELPETLLEAEIERSRQAWRQFLQERLISQEKWLQERSLTLEELETDWRKAAAASVKIGLGLAEAAKDLKKDLQSNEDFQQLLDDLVKKAIDPAP